jgi:hypothetical protein
MHPSKVNPKTTPVYDRDAWTPRFKASIESEHTVNPQRWESLKQEVHRALDRHMEKGKGNIPELDVSEKRHATLRAIVDNQLNGNFFGKLRTSSPSTISPIHLEGELPSGVSRELFGENNEFREDVAKKLRALYDTKRYARANDGSWRLELTPENEKEIVRKMRNNTIKLGETSGMYGHGISHDNLLDAHATKRLKSFSEIKRAGVNQLSSGEKVSLVSWPSKELGFDKPHRLIEREVLKAVRKNAPVGEHIENWCLKNGDAPEEARRVGEIVGKWWADKKSERSEYFEAKPQRFFRLNDFAGAVVPDHMLGRYKDLFDQHGVKVSTYSSNGNNSETDQSRRDAVRKLAEENNLLLSEKDFGLDELIKSELIKELEMEFEIEALVKSEPSDIEEVEKQAPCVLTIIVDGLGKMLFIKRNDNNKWSVCAGHIENNEDPETAARREVLEETGLTPEHLSRIFESKNPNLTCFSAQCQGTPHGRNDPDNEGKPQWVDVTRGIPSNIWDNLAGPEDKTNVVKQLFQQELSLKKGQYSWLDECGFLDLTKGEDDSAHVPLASTQKPPKKLSVVHEPKEKDQKNLLVVHNLSQDKLEHAHEIGGLAAPSIAIHHKNHHFGNYGEVSLIAHPDLIDPEQYVPVFNADAYTARHPRARYKLDKKKTQKLLTELMPHAKTIVEDNHLNNSFSENVENQGVREAIENRTTQAILKTAYLHEKGHPVTPVMKPAYIVHDIVTEKPIQDFFLQHGHLEHIYYDQEDHQKYHSGLTEAFKAALPQYVARKVVEEGGDLKGHAAFKKKRIQKLTKENLELLDEDGLLERHTLKELIRSAKNVGKQEVDKWATQESADDKIKELGAQDDFDRWAINKVKPIQSTPYIPVGARKQPYSMENILRHVTKGPVKGTEQSGSMYGTGFARAKGAKQFSSLQGIRNSQQSLVDHPTFDKWKEESNKKFHAIADKLMRYHESGGFTVMDAIVSAVGNSFKRGGNLASELRRDYFKGVPSDLVGELEQWGKELVHGPTEYFEAKPQRAVSIGEFKGAVVPHDARQETLDLLAQHGITKVERYQKGDNLDRLRAVNKIAEENDLRLSEADLGLEVLTK